MESKDLPLALMTQTLSVIYLGLHEAKVTPRPFAIPAALFDFSSVLPACLALACSLQKVLPIKTGKYKARISTSV
jgi:hypothetical protein